MSPLLLVSATAVLPRAPFTGRVAERRENYPEIMVLIMGQQVAAKRKRRLQMRSGAGRAADGCAGRECWVPQLRIFGELADPTFRP